MLSQILIQTVGLSNDVKERITLEYIKLTLVLLNLDIYPVFGNSVETDQLARIHFCAFSSWSSQNLALSIGIDLLRSTGCYNLNLIVCVNLLSFVCVHIIYLRASLKISCSTKCCYPL